MALQNKVDLLDRKGEIQDAALKKLNKERDMAVSQLGVAYLESQDLKSENEALRQEITDLKARFVQLFPATRQEETGQSEQSTASNGSAEDSQVDTRRSATKDATSKSARSKSKSGRKEDTKSRVSNQVDRELSRLEKERADEELFSIEMPRVRDSSAKKQKSAQPRSTSAQTRKQSNNGKRVKRVVLEEVDLTEPVESTAEATATGHTRKSSVTDQDLTLLSFIDVSIPTFPICPH